MERIETEVLIVGGGGAGLTASMLLSGLGVAHRLVSSLPTTSILPKAHVLGQRAMEVLDDCGVAAQIYEVGTPPAQMSRTRFYAGVAGHPLAGRHLFVQESWGAGGLDPDWVAASPKLTTNLPQIRLEPLMKARAEELAPGAIHFHHELRSIEQDADGVLAVVRDLDEDRDYEVACSYLLGCDGGRSVGTMVGIELGGIAELSRTATIHASIDLSAVMSDDDTLLRWVFAPDTGQLIVLAPMGPTRWGADSEEWVVHVNYGLDDERAFDDEVVLDDVRRGLGIEDLAVDVHLITRWVVGGVLADHFRAGRVFVAGDAAHRHPPTGGLGLVSAIHDVHNLCWKVAAVLRGTAGDALLDTYEPERRAVDERNVARSLENAAGYLLIAEAMGFTSEATPEERWAVIEDLLAATPTDSGRVAKVRELMANQSQEFREHDVEYNYRHRSSAVVEDGSAEPPLANLRTFVPSTHPGRPLPHAWVEDDAYERVSTLDLVTPGRFVLFAGEEGAAWRDAARSLGDELEVPIDAWTIGHATGDWRDPRLRFAQVRDIDPDGAILVRPDRCIAWRSRGSAADPRAELAAALGSILGRTS